MKSVPIFSAEQWAAIAATFGTAQSTPQPHSNGLHGKLKLGAWIIHSGCTNHVTGDESIKLRE